MEAYITKVNRFARVIEQDQARRYREKWLNLLPPEVHVRPGRKYVKVDVGNSGKYMVDAEGNIFGIKAYGVIHRGHRYGTLDTILDWDWSEGVGIKK